MMNWEHFQNAATFFFVHLRPLWVEFPKETETFTVENQYMIGKYDKSTC